MILAAIIPISFPTGLSLKGGGRLYIEKFSLSSLFSKYTCEVKAIRICSWSTYHSFELIAILKLNS